MAKTIRGINVIIGTETTGLGKALEDVNKKSKDIAAELRKVQTALKFNPKDTELLAQRQKLLGDQVAVTREKLERLKVAQEQVNEQFKKGEISEEQYRAFQREVIETESKLKHFEKQLRETGMTAEQFGKRMKDVGKSMTDIGKSLSLKITAPIMAIGTAAAKIGMDFEQSMSKVKAMSGATANEMETLEKAARDAGAATSKSAKEAADALGYMALAGWDVKTSVDGLMPVLRLSEAGNIDLARASSLVTDSMAAMGIEIQDLGKYLDVVAQTARSSNTDIDQMAQAYLGVGGTLRGLNVPLDESALALGLLANAGRKGSEAGNALNAVLINLTAPTGRAKKALEELNFSAFDSQGNFRGLGNVLFGLKDKLVSMTEEQRNTMMAMIGGKEHVKDLNALLNGLEDGYDDLKTSIAEADGALDDVAKTMRENAKGSLIELKSALEEVALKIYDVLRPVIASIIESLKEFVARLNSLSPEMQKTIVIIAGLAAAIGPVLLVLGPLISTVGSLVMGLGAMSTAMAGGATAVAGLTAGFPALGAAITVIAGPIGLAAAGIAAFSYGIVKLVKHLRSDAIPAVKLFSDKVSESTQGAVGAYLELENEAIESLNRLAWGQQTITQEMADQLIGTYNTMNDQILTALEKRYNEELARLEKLFMVTSAITEEEQAEILAKLKEHHEKERQAVEKGIKRIEEITQRAVEAKRAITEAEYKEILLIQEQMRDGAIRTMSESEDEQKAILENLRSEAGKITALQAAEVAKNAIKQKNDVVAGAKEQYKETIDFLERQRDEIGAMSEEQAEKLKEEAQKQRDETIFAAEEMHWRIVAEAEKQAGEHAMWVDWETGEVKTKWQTMKESIVNFAGEIKKRTIREWQEIFYDTKRAWNEIKISILEAIEVIVKAYNKFLELLRLQSPRVTEALANIRRSIETEYGVIGVRWKPGETIADRAKDFREMEGVAKSIGKSVADVTKNFRTLESAVVDTGGKTKKLSEELDDTGNTATDAGTKAKAAAEKIQTAWTGTIEAIKSALGLLSTQHETEMIYAEMAGDKVETLRLKHRQLNTELEAQKAVVAAARAEAEKAIAAGIKEGETKEDLAKRIDELNKKLADEEKAQASLEKQVHDTSQEIKKQGQGAKDLVGELKKVAAAYYTDLAKALEDYEKNVKTTNENLARSVADLQRDLSIKLNDIQAQGLAREKQVTEQFQRELESRARALMDFVGLFDEVTRKEVSGEKLLANLEGQVDAFDDWQKDIQRLAERGIDKGLLEELREMGPKAGAEIAALNTLTDEQLTQYASLWKTKQTQAREEVTTQLAKQREEMNRQLDDIRSDTASQMERQRQEVARKIEEMNAKAKEELEKYKLEWEKKNEEIRLNTEKNIKDIHQKFNDLVGKSTSYGVNLMENFMDGIDSKMPALIAKLETIAGTIDSYMPHSPAKRGPLKRIGDWGPSIIDELIKGIRDSLPRLEGMAARMATLSPPSAVLRPAIANSYSTSTTHNRGGDVIFHPGAIVIQSHSGDAREIWRELEPIFYREIHKTRGRY